MIFGKRDPHNQEGTSGSDEKLNREVLGKGSCAAAMLVLKAEAETESGNYILGLRTA